MTPILGIGLNKTGTRSLADALRELGFRTLHRGDRAASAAVEDDLAHGRPPLTGLGADFDAYFDVEAIVREFARLDAAYPTARFILTTRDLDGWLLSRERHVRGNQERAARGEYDGDFLEVDLDAWSQEFADHHRRVRDHFRGRDDLLEYQVGVDGWEPLASFLDVDVPRTPFPHRNRRGEGTYRPTTPATRLSRARRLVVGRLRRARRPPA